MDALQRLSQAYHLLMVDWMSLQSASNRHICA